MGWNTPPNHFRPIQVISEKRIVLCKTRTGKPGDGRVPQSPVCDVSGDTMGFLAGKRLLITGVLSNRSIAYGIARACKREGGWRLVFNDGKADQALDFSLDEVREASLVPVIDFKGRRAGSQDKKADGGRTQ